MVKDRVELSLNAYKASVLTIELLDHIGQAKIKAWKAITPKRLAREGIKAREKSKLAFWWVQKDSNLQPVGYEPTSLTV